MKLKTLTVAGLVAFMCSVPVSAGASDKSVAERLADLDRRIQYLEQRLADQDKVIVEKDRQIHRLSEQQNEMQGSGAEWPESVEITGLVEVEGGYADPYEGDSETDAVVATVELGIAAQVHDWVSGEILLLFEEDENDDNIDVDLATLTIDPPDGPWFVTGGRMYLPFGVFETSMISDPLTLDLGETRETALMFGIEGENLYGSAFIYNGDNSEDDDNRIDNFGAVLGYAMEGDGMEFGLDIAYINDIGDTDTLQDAVAGNLAAAGIDAVEIDEMCLDQEIMTSREVLECLDELATPLLDADPATYTDHVSGFAASARFRYGDIAFMTEYLAATERFQSTALAYGGSIVDGKFINRGAKPSSWMVEAAYDFMIGSRPATIAVGYQRTDDAVGLELPKTRFMLGGSIELMEQVVLAVEWAHDEDYDEDEWSNCSLLESGDEVDCAFGGTDENAETLTIQLATEF